VPLGDFGPQTTPQAPDQHERHGACPQNRISCGTPGTVVKTFAAYPLPFWRQQGLNGQAASDEDPVKVTFDVSPPGSEVGTCWASSRAERLAGGNGCPRRSAGVR